MDRKRRFEADLTSTLYRHIEDQISRNLTLFLRTFVVQSLWMENRNHFNLFS